MNFFDKRQAIIEKIKIMFIENEELQKAIYYSQPNYLEQPSIMNPYVLFEKETPVLGADNKPIVPKIYFSNRVLSTENEAGVIILVRMIDSPIFNRLNTSKMSVVFTILIHNSLIFTDYGNRFNAIGKLIDEEINGNPWVNEGFSMIPKGTVNLFTQKEWDGINITYETIIPFKYKYNNFSKANRFEL